MIKFRRSQSLPRHTACHRALRGTPLHVPAELLTTASLAEWVRRRGLGVDVSSVEELQVALEAGLPPSRVSALSRDVAAVEAAVAAGVGRFVIGGWAEVLLLAGRPAAAHRVVVDVSEPTGERLASSVLSMGRLDVVGLRCGVAGEASAAEAVRRMIEQMARLRREHGVILTRACLSGYGRADADPQELRQGVHRVQLAVEEACAELRYPRPALVLSLQAATLVES
ncbi:decarboxylase [Mycobacterium sp. GA-2829]|uniref:decarboxylase n=1 Tax=Mycobacterium sp. GA-2829 TaxID=1772283 RepID=UPI00073FD1A9|nr:decarboxylase [Mycobacterium sp. GA-2829]KUI31979.1 decarboxylase [Mycobacterium sp. GA-2829]